MTPSTVRARTPLTPAPNLADAVLFPLGMLIAHHSPAGVQREGDALARHWLTLITVMLASASPSCRRGSGGAFSVTGRIARCCSPGRRAEGGLHATASALEASGQQVRRFPRPRLAADQHRRGGGGRAGACRGRGRVCAGRRRGHLAR